MHDLLWQATVSFGHARSCLHVGSETCRTPAEHLQKPAEHLHMTQPPTNSDQHTNSGEAHVRQPLILAVTVPDCAVWGKESATLESDGLKTTASQHHMLEAQDQACSQTQELSLCFLECFKCKFLLLSFIIYGWPPYGDNFSHGTANWTYDHARLAPANCGGCILYWHAPLHFLQTKLTVNIRKNMASYQWQANNASYSRVLCRPSKQQLSSLGLGLLTNENCLGRKTFCTTCCDKLLQAFSMQEAVLDYGTFQHLQENELKKGWYPALYESARFGG